MIVGIDEVGRGPWAGPLVMGAVVLGQQIDGLTDSKKLTKKRREELNEEILAKAQAVGLGWVSAEEIDELGLSQALTECCKRALQKIDVPYHEIIIDGTVNFLKETGKGGYVTLMKKADLLIPTVSAASIVAKVARDKYMEEQDILYPEYGFKSHVGYGTAAHRAAIEKYGVTPLHRLSFAPLAKYRVGESYAVTTHQQNGFAPEISRVRRPGNLRAADVLPDKHPQYTTKQIGDKAEEAAAVYLHKKGHKILERNWKTKYCEIDIVSQKDDTIYFTEVKYRKNENQGGGIAAITSKKLRQMEFAAKLYATSHDIKKYNLRLMVIAAVGTPPEVEQSLEI